jgi:hypothetical protein
MLALVRDADGQPIHKTSQPYRLTGPAWPIGPGR